MIFRLIEDINKDSLGNTLSAGQSSFFKNSKIKDSSGNLLVCYHGSPKKNIEIFDTANQQMFFTADRKYASEYTYARDDDDEDGIVYTVYLNIINPFDLSTQQQLDFLNKSYIPWLQSHNKNLHRKELVIGKNVRFEDVADDLYWFLKECYQNGTATYDGIIVNEGIDSYIQKGKFSPSANTSYIPLFENQIKSTNNYNPSNSTNINS